MKTLAIVVAPLLFLSVACTPDASAPASTARPVDALHAYVQPDLPTTPGPVASPIHMAVPPREGLPEEGRQLVGTWVADVELEINRDLVPPEELAELEALVAASSMQVVFEADGSMSLIADMLGERQEQPGRWRFLSMNDGIMRIGQVAYIDGATEELVEIQFVERNVIRVDQDGTSLVFYRAES